MKIDLVPYNPNWPRQYKRLEMRLMKRIGHLDPVIEHIGSTAVPGLVAKPTIDVQIGVQDEESLDALHECLVPSGFTRNSRWDEDLPFRRFFQWLEQRPGGLEVPTEIDKNYEGDLRGRYYCRANIHCTELKHPWHDEHVLFRDYLREHPEDRSAYQKEKRRLSKKDWKLTADYAEAKDKIIGRIKKKMYEWQSGQST